MGRISDIIPALYHGGNNDLIRFIDSLDVEADWFEQKVKGITDLINVDKCPDDKLPYLASLTGCPLMGNTPALWRRQIKNWPYVLKLKGTERSLDLFLRSIDVDAHILHTFFRDETGELVEDKPKGEPFIDSDGGWRNIRTHIFDLDAVFKDGHWLRWPEWHEDLLRSINIWLTRAKPFHAELRNLKIFLLRNKDMPISVGTATNQVFNHEINISQVTDADAELGLSVGTGISHRLQHNIAIDQATDGTSELGENVGASFIQSGHHSISIKQAISADGGLNITIGAGTFQRQTHEISIEQGTEAEMFSTVSVGTSAVQAASHEVGIIHADSGSINLNLPIGTGILQDIRHEVNIQHATKGETDSLLSVGACAVQGGHHILGIAQAVSANCEAAISVGTGIHQNITHNIYADKPDSNMTEARISASCVVSCGISIEIKMAA